MPRFITPPDLGQDRTIPKVLIRNVPWTETEIVQILDQLSDKNYDIYLYNDSMNDIQWCEGIRTHSQIVLDWRHYRDRDPVEWLRELDDKVKL